MPLVSIAGPGSKLYTSSGGGGEDPDGNDGLIVTDFADYDPDDADIISLDINDTLSTGISTGASVDFANETWWNGTTGVATIRPPTIGDGYAGINGIDIWKNATKAVRQVNIRQEFRASDLYCDDTTEMPKFLILVTYQALSTGADVDRPMLYLNHMNDGGTDPSFHIADSLVISPAQGTVRYFSATDITPAPASYEDRSDSTYTTYPAMRQPFYIRATSGTDGAGNPIVDGDEYLCIETRVNCMATADEPEGTIAVRVTRQNGSSYTRCCAFTWWDTENLPEEQPQVDTNYIGFIDIMGLGYTNNANDGNANRFTKLGRRITIGTNLSPTVGRYFMGTPTNFVTA